jgi:threonyl-tRNA synthetase|tara:strand:- start:1162 stop:1626 length:465 start_codon:yes stop_codon:yes gene_type:complete
MIVFLPFIALLTILTIIAAPVARALNTFLIKERSNIMSSLEIAEDKRSISHDNLLLTKSILSEEKKFAILKTSHLKEDLISTNKDKISRYRQTKEQELKKLLRDHQEEVVKTSDVLLSDQLNNSVQNVLERIEKDGTKELIITRALSKIGNNTI